MDISKISNQTISRNIEDAKKYLTKEEIEECNLGLSFADSNKDGVTTGIDMYKKWSQTCENLFAGNDVFLKRGEELSTQMGELYARYSGSDGILDAYEYDAALQSDEMGVLIEEYWEMKNIVEAENNEEVLGLSHYDSNNDGNVSAIELFKERSNLFSKIFADDKQRDAEAQKIIQEQAEIISKYAGDDGFISSEEYSLAVQSSEYQQTINEYNKLMQ